MEVVLVTVMTVIVKVTVVEFKVAESGYNHNDVGNGEDNDVNNSKAPKGCQS